MKASGPGQRARIDWEAARQRLAKLEADAPAALAQAVLAARAARLAVPLFRSEELGRWLELLTFRSATRHYAIESRWILEVTKCGRVSRVPGADPAMIGITNLRGDLLPVFDVGRRLVGTSDRSLAGHLIVLGEQEPDFGLLVDALEGVVRVAESSLTRSDALGALPHPEQFRGITQEGCVVLDGAAMLHDQKLFVARSPTSAAPEREEH